MSALVPRPACRDCGRPLFAWVPAALSTPPFDAGESRDPARVAVRGACFCDRVTVLPTRTRILLLQHPRERRMAVGTARMAQRALPGSRLRVGIDFAADEAVLAELARSPASYVLFPGPGAVPIHDLPRDRAVSLVVLDGTWWQARKLLKLNPAIAALPRIAFFPRKPSAYRIRRQPADFCVSTIEALAEVLAVLEPDGGRFERLLDPFHAMVERQQWFQSQVRTRRQRGSPRPVRVSPRASLAARLDADWSRLVCVHGEANAWPRRHPLRQEPETVHWVAYRPATGETFERVLAPRQSLTPATCEHLELSPERFRAGCTVQEWHDAWRDFSRPDDVVVMWGTFYANLAAADGLPLSSPGLNLREEAGRVLGRRAGTVEQSSADLGATPARLALSGRGGRRLAALVGALESLRTLDSIAV